MRPGTRLIAPLSAVGAGFGAGLCCIGPILFALFGVGAGLGSTFTPLRPVFTVLMLAALAAAGYSAFRRPPECEPGAACATPATRTRDRRIFWGAAVLAVLFWTFTYWSGILV